MRKNNFKVGDLVKFSKSGSPDGSWDFYEDLEDDFSLKIPSGTPAIITEIKPFEDSDNELGENISVLVKGYQTSGWFPEAFIKGGSADA